jgi:hypothetical protein
MKHKNITISAKTAEEFAEIEKKLATLSVRVASQIETAFLNSMFGVECVLKPAYGKNNSLWFPKAGQVQIRENEHIVITDEFKFVIPIKVIGNGLVAGEMPLIHYKFEL